MMSNAAPDHRVRLCDGTLWDPWDPSGPPPAPSVFAFAAANLCRYGGHVSRHLSVAEHTLWVLVRLVSRPPEVLGFTAVASTSSGVPASADLASLLRSRSPRWPQVLRRLPAPVALQGLLGWVHDGPEGFGLVDMLKPVKERPEMAPYSEADLRHLRHLCRAWHLPPPPSGEFVRFDAWLSPSDGPPNAKAVWEAEMSARGFLPDGSPTPERTLWAEVWRADHEVMGPERVLRPWCDGTHRTEKMPGWSWLDLALTHCLDDGETPGARRWVQIALCQAWDALREAAGLPEVPAALSGGGLIGGLTT